MNADEAVSWWLLSSNYNNTNNFNNINTSGGFNNNNATNAIGVVARFFEYECDGVR